MRFNNYPEALQPLRSRAIEPSFEEIRTMVLNEKPSRKIVVPFWFFLSAGIPLAALVAILLFPEIVGLYRNSTSLNTEMRHHQPVVQSLPQAYTNIIPSRSAEHSKPQVIHNEASKRVTAKVSDMISPTSGENTDEPRSLNDTAVLTTIDKPVIIETPLLPTAISAGVAETGLPALSPDRLRWSAVISGGYFSARPEFGIFDRLLASAALRYNLNSTSSVIVELRRHLFMQKFSTSKTTFRDTLVTVGNRTFYNSIGEVSYVPAESVMDVFALGTGVHIALIEFGAVTPFIEALLGAGPKGALTSEVAGLTYALNNPLSVEFSLRADEFFSLRSSPHATVSLGMGFGYSW